MIEEAVCVGGDVAKSAMDVAVTDSRETWQFANDDEGVSQAVSYIARATGTLAKTDTIDARILALFGARVKPEIRPLPNREAREIRNLLTRRRQLIEMLTAEHNRVSQADDGIRSYIETHIKWLETALSDINDDLDNQIRSSPS